MLTIEITMGAGGVGYLSKLRSEWEDGKKSCYKCE